MKKKILIVDDNRLLRKFLSTHLERAGHQVRAAEDGFAALDVLSEFAPDVMFVDLFMPKIDGDRLCQIVRSRDDLKECYLVIPVSYTHLTLPTRCHRCRSRWSPDH